MAGTSQRLVARACGIAPATLAGRRHAIAMAIGARDAQSWPAHAGVAAA